MSKRPTANHEVLAICRKPQQNPASTVTGERAPHTHTPRCVQCSCWKAGWAKGGGCSSCGLASYLACSRVGFAQDFLRFDCFTTRALASTSARRDAAAYTTRALLAPASEKVSMVFGFFVFTRRPQVLRLLGPNQRSRSTKAFRFGDLTIQLRRATAINTLELRPVCAGKWR